RAQGGRDGDPGRADRVLQNPSGDLQAADGDRVPKGVAEDERGQDPPQAAPGGRVGEAEEKVKSVEAEAKERTDPGFFNNRDLSFWARFRPSPKAAGEIHRLVLSVSTGNVHRRLQAKFQ